MKLATERPTGRMALGQVSAFGVDSVALLSVAQSIHG